MINIQLIKIVKDEPSTAFPACVKSVGTAPKQYKVQVTGKDQQASTETGMAALMNDLDDSEAYNAAPAFTAEEAFDEEETASMEGEEGEEEEGEGDSEDGNEEGDEYGFGDNDSDKEEY